MSDHAALSMARLIRFAARVGKGCQCNACVPCLSRKALRSPPVGIEAEALPTGTVGNSPTYDSPGPTDAERYRAALAEIEAWADGRPTTYGSQGEREYVRGIARAALGVGETLPGSLD